MENKLATLLLSIVVICATVLTAIGVLSKSELLPVLGGIVVVAHRLIDSNLRQPKETKEPPKPPTLTGTTMVVGGMAAAGVIANLLI